MSTTLYWVGQASSDIDHSSNWDTTPSGAGGAGVPDHTTFVSLQGGYINPIAPNVDLHCSGIQSTNEYTNDIDFDGNNIYCSGSVYLDHSGSLTLGNGRTIIYEVAPEDSGDYHIGNQYLKSFNPSHHTIEHQASGAINIDISHSDNAFKDLDLAYFNNRVINTSSETLYASGDITLNSASGKLELGSTNLSIGGNWDNTISCSVDAGTSEIVFDSEFTTTIDSGGESFYDVIINKTSNGLTLADAFSCNTLEVDDGDFDQNGQTITSASDITIDGDDTITLDSDITMTGDGDFHIGSTISTLLAAGCNLDLQGTGNLDVDKTHSGSPFNNVECAYNGKTTTQTSTTLYINSVLTLNNSGGTFTNNGNTILMANGVVTPFVHNNATISGLTSKYISFQETAASTVTVNCTDIGYTNFKFYTGTTDLVTYNLSGTFTTMRDLFIDSGVDVPNAVVNTQNNDLNIKNQFKIRNIFGTATGDITLNCGSSTFDVGHVLFDKDAGADISINLQTSTWTVEYSWDNSDGCTVDAGTSTVTFDGSVSRTIDSGSQSFYALVINKTGNGITVNDALSVNTLEVDNGNFDQNGQTITSASDITIDGDDTITLDGPIIMTGDGTFHIGTTLSSITSSTASGIFQGNTTIDLDKASSFDLFEFDASGYIVTVAASGMTVGRLDIKPGTSGIFTAGSTSVISGHLDGDWGGDAAGSSRTFITSTAGGSAAYWTVPSSVTEQYMYVKDNHASQQVDVSDGTSEDGTGTTNWLFAVGPGPASDILIGPLVNPRVHIKSMTGGILVH